MAFSKYSHFLLLILVGVVIFETVSCQDYTKDLRRASVSLSKLLPTSDDVRGFKDLFYTRVLGSVKAKKYFLHGLKFGHDILNQEDMKGILEFLTTNGVDVNKLFSISTPKEVLEKLQNVDVQAEDSDEEEGVDSPPAPKGLTDVIDMELLITTLAKLLRENEGCQELFRKLSNPSLLMGVYEIVTSHVYIEFLGYLSDINSDGMIPVDRVKQGVLKMFNAKGDKRNASPVLRFIEGAKVMADCENKKLHKICKLLDEEELNSKNFKSKSTEL